MDREIDILGEIWKIIKVSEDEDDRIINQAGFMDKSTREIGLMELEPRVQGEVMDRDKMSRHTLRHEIIHALIAECGIDQYIDWAASEEVVDFFAYHFPRLNKIFKELGIEQ